MPTTIKQPDTGYEHPVISVVIATYNRRAMLKTALNALEGQNVTAETFEVVIIDDGSTDDTANWLSQHQFCFTCRTLSQPNQGAASARNAGIDIARGEYVLFLDDDLIAEPELIAEHLRIHTQSPASVVLGPALSLPTYQQPWVAWQQNTLDKTYRVLSSGDTIPSFRHFWSGNCSLSRSTLMETGGFNTAFPENEDVELGYRLMECGLGFVFNPLARGYHHSSRGFAGWRAAHALYGRTDVEILRRLGHVQKHAALRDEWQQRHPLTRTLAGWATKGSLRYQTVVTSLSAMVYLGTLAPMSQFSRMTCAALANVIYWNGVRISLGEDWHLISEPDSSLSRNST